MIAKCLSIAMEKTMPQDTIIALIPVFLLFGFFAATIIWADINSRKR